MPAVLETEFSELYKEDITTEDITTEDIKIDSNEKNVSTIKKKEKKQTRL